MMIQTWPSAYEAAAVMWRMANLPFSAATFRAQCMLLGELDTDDGFLWQYRRADGPPLIVGANGDTVDVALLSSCWWATYDRHFDHRNDETSHKIELAAFDDAFHAAQDAAVAVAGPPLKQGRDRGRYQHRWALWQGRTGLFAVQQSDYDIQFGLDVNFWVTGWDSDTVEPGDPFFIWLTKD
jgi:hypothetical protein